MEYPIDTVQRQEEAKRFFRQGYNCSQSVLLAFRDLLGLDEETVAKTGTGLGGGVGRMREVCGTVSAMAIAAGFIKPAASPSDLNARRESYALVQDMAEEFRRETGSIVCRDLLAIRKDAKETPQPSERTAEYYRSRPCEALTGLAAKIIAERINQFFK